MTVKIMETGDIRELSAVFSNGVDSAQDIAGEHLGWDDEQEMYTVDTESNFSWWENYLANRVSDSAELEALAQEYGDAVYGIVAEEMGTDMDGEHAAYQAAFERVRAELEAR